MKRTITGWITPEQLIEIGREDSRALPTDSLEVTLTFDDGKPALKTVWEWMYRDGDVWCVADALMDEATAAKALFAFQHKKLREFSVEVGE